MANLSPDRTLLKERRKPFVLGVYEIESADNGNTIELGDFADTDAILTATIINMKTGATVTQAAIVTNVLTISDATIGNDPIIILAYGWMMPSG